MTSNMFNFRVDDDLDDAIVAAAKKLGVNRSVWAREILGAVALGGVTMEDLTLLVEAKGNAGESPHPERFLTLQAQIGRKYAATQKCIHPVTGRKRMPFTIICGVCGDVVKRT